MRFSHKDESGLSLIELMIATALMAILMATVATAILETTGQTSSMSRQTQAIDQLQIAEQEVVRDIHAATTWCATPTSSQLSFVASLPNTPVLQLTIGSGELTVATGTYNKTQQTCGSWSTPASALVSNLDATSAFTVSSPASWTGTVLGKTYDYWPTIGVNLTVDTVGAHSGSVVKTTTADPTVEVWNQEYACQSSWQQDPGSGTEPC
jgi:prepilin-type N-terminal cleavage/methylation domain-containing protein